MKYTGAAVLVFALFAPVAGQAQPMGLPSMGSASSAELSPLSKRPWATPSWNKGVATQPISMTPMFLSI